MPKLKITKTEIIDSSEIPVKRYPNLSTVITQV